MPLLSAASKLYVGATPATKAYRGTTLVWSSSAPKGYFETIRTDSPAAYWRLGEAAGATAADSSGNARDATYSGGYTLGQTGAVTGADTAVLLNGTTGKVTRASETWMNTGLISLEAWVKVPTPQASYASVLTKSSKWGLFLVDGKPTVYDWPAAKANTTASSVADGQWHHLVAALNGASSVLYVDGVVGLNFAWTVGTFNTADLQIGANNSAQFYGGSVDEVAVYTYQLSAAQVAAHYAAASAPSSAIYPAATLFPSTTRYPMGA